MTTPISGPMKLADIVELSVIGDAMFHEWYPLWRTGDPIPARLPLHVQLEAHDLGMRHKHAAARNRTSLDAQ
ncbi:hypothetical protein [Sphingomonas psychrolutea]|uniref:Uncharacterized protein n=1 Tax=Sphingomonas psychrolutea TaxID=1259676 RepID=A0ABQ1H7J0_9SPHN|nr:hypothetical protein [Sphingomonas psychrolutea]GGA62475.1 hypothetical protein GCM10011395_35860 [Sphingomonas psychrolutea]